MQYSFTGSYSDQDKKLFSKSQEEDLEKICQFTNTRFKLTSDKIIFKVFDSREAKQKADPNHSISRASARFSIWTVYRVWTTDMDIHFPHEITHLVAHTWAKPYIMEFEVDTWDNKKIKRTEAMVSTSFMQEGLAIALDEIIFQRKLLEEGEVKFPDEWCKEQIDKIPASLISCINMEGFDSFENKLIVPFSASFSKYLIKKYGFKKYQQMYIKLQENFSPEKNIKILEDVYGSNEKELLKSWRETIL